MKYISIGFSSIIIILVIVVIWSNISSEGNRYSKELEDIEDVVETNPDSAYRLLNSYERFSFGTNERNNAMYGLLLTQVKYKLYKDSPDSLMPIIEHSESFFRNSLDRQHHCKALYYLSMMLNKTGRIEEATLKLREGLDIAKTLRDTLQMVKYYESLCMVNDFARCHKLMQSYAKMMLDMSVCMNDKERIVRSLNNLAASYWRQDMPDSAMYYRKKALAFLDGISDVNRAYLLTNLGSDYIHINEFDSARHYLQEALTFSPLPNAYKMLGDIYERDGHEILARANWEKAILLGSPRVRLNTIKSIIDASQKNGNNKLATYYYNQYIQLNDSIQASSSESLVSELQAKYDYVLLKNQKNKRIVVLQFVIILSLLILALFFWWHKSRVRIYESVIESKNLLVRQKETELSSIYEDVRIKQNHLREIESLVQDKDKKIGFYVEEIESLTDDICQQEQKIELLNKEIFDLRSATLERLGKGRDVYSSVKNGGKIPNSVPEAEHCFIDFFTYFHNEKLLGWNETYKSLTPRLITYLILDDMGFDDVEKERILGVGRAAIGMTKTRLKRNRKNP